MRLILSHQTAYRFWLSSLSIHRLEFEGNAGWGSSRDRRELSDILSSLGRSGASSHEIEILVPAAADRLRIPGITCHVWCGPRFPADQLVCIGQGIHVVSPELCFLQMASRYSGLELVRMGTDLCSLYAYPYNFWRGTLCEREAITSRKRIVEFLERGASGLAGIKEARRCAPLLLERSRSPRESTLACLLASPSRMGGQGLAGMEVNVEIPLSRDEALLTPRSYLEVDLCWRSSNLCVEYNSHLHDTNEAAYRDLEKVTVLQTGRMTVMPLNTEQMNSYASFEYFVKALRRHLGIRHQETAAMAARRRQAHFQLLEAERRWGKMPSLTDDPWWQALLPSLGLAC